MIRVTASEFQQAFATLIEQAEREPVIITKDGRDILVAVPIAEWQRLSRRDRRVGLTTSLSEEWIEAIRREKQAISV